MRYPACLRALYGALLPPRLKVLDLADCPRVLDPLNDLRHRHKVHVVMVGEDLVDPVEESIEEFGIVLEPRGVEVETERRTVLFVVAIKVVVEEVVELFAGEDVGARVDHSAAGQVLVVGGVLAAVELVHDHLPDGVAASGAAL